MLVDAANLRSVVRVLRMGRDADYLATVLFPGGSVSEARVLKAADGEALESVYFATPLRRPPLRARLPYRATDSPALKRRVMMQ